MPLSKKKRRLLLVKWDDVSSYTGWIDIDEAKYSKPFQAKMVGWEVHRDKKNLILATGFAGDECNGRRVIPRGCIKSVKVLKE